MLSFKKISLGIILLLALLVLVLCEDEEKKEEEEEKDPWDKSTDKYRHHLGDSRAGDHDAEPVKIDVTEVSESEVHSGRSKVCKNCKKKVAVARKAPFVAKPRRSKPRRKPNAQYFNKNDVDDETKEQIIDATDEKDPADSKLKDSKYVPKSRPKQHRKQRNRASKKQLNPKINYNPGSYWEYPYPYNTNLMNKYGCGENDQECDAAIEAKEEAKEQDSLSSNVLFASDAKAPKVATEAKIDAAVPPEESALPGKKKPADDEKLKPQPVPKIEAKEDKKSKTKKTKKKEAVTVLPKIKAFNRRLNGHDRVSEIGTSWETPCFYKKKCSVPHRHCKHQLIPVHYYGPPSAGWGGFQPGHTGGGWGVPHWNKKCHTPRVNCKGSYINPGKNSWFIYNPQESVSWGATPGSWYRNGLEQYAESPGTMRYKVSRPEATINRITPLVVNPRARNNVAALHEWISFLENEREKDRQLERYKLDMRDKENQRRYNLEVLRYKQAQEHNIGFQSRFPLARGSSERRYYSKPQLDEQEFENRAVDYVLNRDGLRTTLYNDKK